MDARAESIHTHAELSTQDMFTKDAFLVFRALCKLTMKPLNTERFVCTRLDLLLISSQFQRARLKIACDAVEASLPSPSVNGFELTHESSR